MYDRAVESGARKHELVAACLHPDDTGVALVAEHPYTAATTVQDDQLARRKRRAELMAAGQAADAEDLLPASAMSWEE